MLAQAGQKVTASRRRVVEKVDTVVIGAGVIGLAVARALSQRCSPSKSSDAVYLIDQSPFVGSETTSRNSGVIHAGIYYPTNSLKARLCVRGRHLLYDYIGQRGIGHERLGKLLVPTRSVVVGDDNNNGKSSSSEPTPEEQFTAQMEKLHGIHKQARINNGVDDLRLLTLEDLRSLEPEVSPEVPVAHPSSSRCALFSPSTGIVDVHDLCQSLLVDAEEAGTTLALNTPILDADLVYDGDAIPCVQLQAGPDLWLQCRRVINCAGLYADAIARRMHRNGPPHILWTPPRQSFCKGNYFQLTQTPKAPFSHLVYPLPGNGGLGIHATLDLAGRVRFGPDVEWLEKETNHHNNMDSVDNALDLDFDYSPNPNRKDIFERTIRSYWPGLPNDSLEADYAGIRPKVSSGDFEIVGPAIHGVPGLVHLFGMESPGLTSSLAVGEYVADHILTQTPS